MVLVEMRNEDKVSNVVGRMRNEERDGGHSQQGRRKGRGRSEDCIQRPRQQIGTEVRNDDYGHSLLGA